jgi:hypothetical protein
MWILELRYRFYAGETARALNYTTDMTDRGLDNLDDRIIRLEEIIAAGWPRSMALRRRLRRELRAVDAQYAEAADGFRDRRAEWAGTEIIIAAREGARRRRERLGGGR